MDRDENPWIRASTQLDCAMHCVRAGSAAPAARSWVGWVRVVGAADVIDALDAWQKHPFRRIPSPGQHRSGSFGSRSELFQPVISARSVNTTVTIKEPMSQAATSSSAVSASSGWLTPPAAPPPPKPPLAPVSIEARAAAKGMYLMTSGKKIDAKPSPK